MFQVDAAQKLLEEHQAQLKRNSTVARSGSLKVTGVQRGGAGARHMAQNARDAARILQGLDSKVAPVSHQHVPLCNQRIVIEH